MIKYGLRVKTWSLLVLGLLAAGNFMLVANLWPPNAKWPVHLAFSGWFIISTIAFTLAMISEARRKPGSTEASEIYQHAIKNLESSGRLEGRQN